MMQSDTGSSDDVTALQVSFAGMQMRSPIVAASGTFGYGHEYSNMFLSLDDIYSGRFSDFGAIVLKTVTLEPRVGNAPPRTIDTYAGLINSIGLENVGVRRLVTDHLPAARGLGTNIVVSIGGRTVEEYGAVADELRPEKLNDPEDYAAVEVNVSCPNVQEGGLEFGATGEGVASVLKVVRSQIPDRPVIAKLTPNVHNIGEIAVAAVEAGASGVSLINTVSALAIDHKTRTSILGASYGGLSGPAIKPIGLHRVHSAYRALRGAGLSAPIIGIGGIFSGQDALEYVVAGACAVGLGTALLCNPNIASAIRADMESFVAEEIAAERISCYSDLVGSLDTSR